MISKTLKKEYSLSLKNANDFLNRCVRDNLANSLLYKNDNETWVKPYPEVSGYLLTYFCKKTPSPKLLKEMMGIAGKLISLQHPSGGFPSFYDQEYLYTFDTAQIMNGLLSLYKVKNDQIYLQSATRAGDFLCNMQLPSGCMFPIFDTRSHAKIVHSKSIDGTNWGSTFSYIQVKNAEGLLLLYKITKNKKYLRCAHRLSNINLEKVDYLYTHPLAYYLEGLLVLGEMKKVKSILKNIIIPRIDNNGFIAYYPGARYAYVSGSVQMGILLWKVGFTRYAKRVLSWAQLLQEMSKSGGLYQYAQETSQPDYSIHGEINSWGTKYYGELLKLVAN